MTFHNSSPEFYSAAATAAEQMDALVPDWQDRQVSREDARMVDESDVLDPDATVIWGYGGDHRAVASFGRND